MINQRRFGLLFDIFKEVIITAVCFSLFHLSWRDNEKLDLRLARANELRYAIERTKQFRCYSKTKQNPQNSPLQHLFFSYNQPLSCVCTLVFEESTPAPKSVIICVCRFKGGKPLKYSCQQRGMSGDNGVGLHKTSVVGNSPDKIHNKHAKVSQPPPHPAAARW